MLRNLPSAHQILRCKLTRLTLWQHFCRHVAFGIVHALLSSCDECEKKSECSVGMAAFAVHGPALEGDRVPQAGKERARRRQLRPFVLFLGVRLPVHNINSRTNGVFSPTAPGCRLFHGTRRSRHSCPPAHSRAFTLPALLSLRPVYPQHVAHVLDTSRERILPRHRSWVAVSSPLSSPPALSLSPQSASTLFFSRSLFSILSCRGKRGPEESNNCDSGAFLALFLKLCRHTQCCLLALMKG